MSRRKEGAKTRLHMLLLREPFGPHGEPLFSSQTEVAQAHVAAGIYEKRSAQAFFNQVFNGLRTAPRKMVDGIARVAVARATERGHVISEQEMRARVEEACDADRRQRLGQRYGMSPDPVAGLIACQHEAKSVFILNRRPIELTGLAEQRPAAGDLTRDALRAMAQGRKYAWCLDSRSTAIQLLGALRSGIISHGIGEPDALLEQWTRQGTLAVRVVAPELCLHPTAVFDPAGAERMSAWAWYVPYGWETCLRMPREFHPSWLERVYDPIVHAASDASRISWEEARAALA